MLKHINAIYLFKINMPTLQFYIPQRIAFLESKMNEPDWSEIAPNRITAWMEFQSMLPEKFYSVEYEEDDLSTIRSVVESMPSTNVFGYGKDTVEIFHNLSNIHCICAVNFVMNLHIVGQKES